MNSDYAGLFTLLIVASVILAMVAGLYIGSDHTKQEALRNQCAEYNITTGKFQWKRTVNE